MIGTAPDYRDQLVALLPPGLAWPRDADSTLVALLGGPAEELARVDARADALFDEADPRTVLELLVDWERVAGLPDPCSGAPTEIGERQVALTNKIAQRGGQSIVFFIELAARLGYYAEIVEFTSCDAGFAAGAPCNGENWRHAWEVRTFVGSDEYRSGLSEFVAGSSAGDRLIGFGSLDLECLINRARPAHSQVIFSYIVDPDPLFWADFTTNGDS